MNKNEIKVHKLTEYINADEVTRVALCAVKDTEMLGGLASSKQFGSIVLKEGTSLKDAEKAFPEGSVLEGVKFGNPDDDGFYRIIPA